MVPHNTMHLFQLNGNQTLDLVSTLLTARVDAREIRIGDGCIITIAVIVYFLAVLFVTQDTGEMNF